MQDVITLLIGAVLERLHRDGCSRVVLYKHHITKKNTNFFFVVQCSVAQSDRHWSTDLEKSHTVR